MKVTKNNVFIIWSVLAVLVVAFLLLATLLPPTPQNLVIGVVMFVVAVLLLIPLLSYYRNNPDGKKAVKEAEAWHEHKRLIKECKKLDRKRYRRKCLERQMNDSDFLPMN